MSVRVVRRSVPVTGGAALSRAAITHRRPRSPTGRRSRSASSHGQWEGHPSYGDIDLTWGGRWRPPLCHPWLREHSATAGAARLRAPWRATREQTGGRPPGRTSSAPLATASRPANTATHAPSVRPPRMMDAPRPTRPPLATERCTSAEGCRTEWASSVPTVRMAASSRALRTAAAGRGRYRLRGVRTPRWTRSERHLGR